jgi:hypothetical protein
MSKEKGSLRQNGTWGAAAFGVTLAVIIGLRLDQAALAAVVGVICGIGASIPTSVLVVSVLRRREAQDTRREAAHDGRLRSRAEGERWRVRREMAQSPPVLVITAPGASQPRQAATWPGEYVAPVPAQRQFSIIGEEEIENV